MQDDKTISIETFTLCCEQAALAAGWSEEDITFLRQGQIPEVNENERFVWMMALEEEIATVKGMQEFHFEPGDADLFELSFDELWTLVDNPVVRPIREGATI